VTWTQTGHKDGSPGMIRFDSDSGLFSIAVFGIWGWALLLPY